MQILGMRVPFTGTRQKAMVPVDAYRGSWLDAVVRESYPGAWQQNVEVRSDTVLTFSAVYACITLISGDIGKLRLRLVAKDGSGIWNETENAAYSPVIRKPNTYQTRVAFIEHWVTSKLVHGNTYVLKERDNRNVVTGLHVLDPSNVRVLVSDVSGEVFYELKRDDLAGLERDVIVIPASEIIHDTMKPFFHPLVGVSPLTAAGLAAVQGLEIQKNAAKFFANGSRPGGILAAPGSISDETAARLKAYWLTNFSGDNAGKLAVLGDGLKFEQMVMKATDAQMLEQLRWSAENVAMCFHVPPYKIGVGQIPTYQNAAILNQIYYSDCLQTLIEALEALLDEGLELTKPYGVEFDLDDLLRMDVKTQIEAYAAAVGSALMSPDEGRRKINLAPKPGGGALYLQEQNFSLEALAKRDAKPDPWATAPAPQPEPDPEPEPEPAERSVPLNIRFVEALFRKAA